MALITNCKCIDATIIIAIIIISVIIYFKRKFTFFEKSGVPTLPPIIPFGNAKDLMLGRISFGQQFHELYKRFKGHKLCGFYLSTAPMYVPLDVDLVKHIMHLDFSHFNGHGGYLNEEHDPLSGHLFNLDGSSWRNLRVKLTPTFTSGKMKMMFHTLVDISEKLNKLLDESALKNEEINVKNVMNRFGIDVISSVAFGLEANSLDDPNVPFAFYGKKATTLEFWDHVKIFMQVILPQWFLRLIKHKFTKRDVEAFFMKTIRETVDYREKNNVYRKDFMHLLLQLKNLGNVSDDGQIKDETGESKEVALTFNQLAAQAYVFFMAGYETSASTLTFALYELASNPDVQKKLREEITSVLEKHGGNVTYEALMQMTYMEKVLQETLRKYPPLPQLTRLCNEDYKVPDSDVVIKKGCGVLIPILGIQRDPEYFPDPEKFDPERFSEENKHTRPAFTWLPFGEGPRICIGMRFGMLQSKIGLLTFLKNYNVKLGSKTITPIKFKHDFMLRVEGEMWVHLEKM